MEPVRARLAHAIPGRIRARIPREQLSEQVAIQLRQALLALPGVLEVEPNVQTGSLVIHYDMDQLDTTGVIELVRDAGLYILDVLPGQETEGGSGRPSAIAGS